VGAVSIVGCSIEGATCLSDFVGLEDSGRSSWSESPGLNPVEER
jgi:hypothetical protein